VHYVDPVEVSPNEYKTVLEEDGVRVVEMVLPPGVSDTEHSHPTETVYFITGGRRESTFRTAPRMSSTSPAGWLCDTRPGRTGSRTSATPRFGRWSSRTSPSST